MRLVAGVANGEFKVHAGLVFEAAESDFPEKAACH
jgi:hypothetical protein